MNRFLLLVAFMFSVPAYGQTLVWESGFENDHDEWHPWEDPNDSADESETRPTGSQYGSHYWVDCDPAVGAPEGDCVFHSEVFRHADASARGYRVLWADGWGNRPQPLTGPFCHSWWLWVDLGDTEQWLQWARDRAVGWWSPSTVIADEQGWPNSRGQIWVVEADKRLDAGSSRQDTQCSTDPIPERRWSHWVECYHGQGARWNRGEIWIDGQHWCSSTDDYTDTTARAFHWGTYAWGIPALTQYEDDHKLYQLSAWPSDMTNPPVDGGSTPPPDPAPGDSDPGDSDPGDAGGPPPTPGDPPTTPSVQPVSISCKDSGILAAIIAALATLLAGLRKVLKGESDGESE